MKKFLSLLLLLPFLACNNSNSLKGTFWSSDVFIEDVDGYIKGTLTNVYFYSNSECDLTKIVGQEEVVDGSNITHRKKEDHSFTYTIKGNEILMISGDSASIKAILDTSNNTIIMEDGLVLKKE